MNTSVPMTDTQGHLLRRPLVANLMERRGDALVVCGLGSPTYDVSAAGEHPGTFYFWGAMGLTTAAGLGLAMARPERRVVVVTGDGDMMMGIGSLATIAGVAPKNLAILVLDNQSFGETGKQTGLTAGRCDIAAMASGAGFDHAMTLENAGDVDDLADLLFVREGPVMAVARVALSDDPKSIPVLDGTYLAQRFRGDLGLPPF